MKKQLLIAGALGLALSSCTIYHKVEVTGAPIGTKEGVSKKGFRKGDELYGAAEAAKNGKITTVGAIEYRVVNYFGPINRFITKVYGE